MTSKLKRNLIKQQGQSTIEFIFCFSFATFILIYTVKIALNYTSGYLVHYATFMASRAYAVYENNTITDGTQVYNHAKAVFEGTRVHIFNDDIDVDKLDFTVIDNSPENYLHAGAFFDWETAFSVGGLFGGSQMLQLRSESYLGREPTRMVCAIRTCQVARGSGTTCDIGRAFTLDDNGC